MGLYIININETTEKGKQLKRMLRKKESGTTIYPIQQYEKQEELALMKIMGKAGKDELLPSDAIRNALVKLKKQASK